MSHRLDTSALHSYYTALSLRESTRPGSGIIEPCLLAKLLLKDEARRIAANIAKLPELLRNF